MKKNSFLMLFALMLFFVSCRNELDSLQESTPSSLQAQEFSSSQLISMSRVKKEIKSFSKIHNKFIGSKTAKTSGIVNSDNVLYRKWENAATGAKTYTLPINTYSAENPYYMIQQILVSSTGVETTRYLKIIPTTPPAYKTQDVLKTLTGSIEIYDEDLSFVFATDYINGIATENGNKQLANKSAGECTVSYSISEVTCSNGGGHGVGASCNPGLTNDAHYVVNIDISCPHDFGPSGIGNPGTGSSGSGSLGGGYVFDEQLNSLLTNPTFLYGDYLTSPGHELLLQIVRQWIPSNITDLNGDLSDLNNRLQHFSNNDQMFNDLAVYNQNTPNVPNAEVTDYSIRVYELFKFLLNNPSPENGQIAAWAVSFFDQNRFVSWEEFRNTHILNTGFVSYINTLPMTLKQTIYNQSNQAFLFGLNSYYSSQGGSQKTQNFINWALQFKANDSSLTWAQFQNWFIEEPILNNTLQNELFEDWADPNRVKPTTRFKNHTKINGIYNQIKSASNFKQYLQNFEPTFSVAHLMFDLDATQNPNALAETNPPSNYWIKIIFNKNKDWNNTPKVVIADTFMHEMIHAEIYRKLMSLASTNGNIDVNKITADLLQHNYPGLFDYYVRFTNGDADAQHQLMAAHYVNIMVNFLKQVYGTQYSDVEYKTIVWMGLQGTKAWNLLQQSEKTLYLNTWNSNYWLWEL
ncbi:hypothetical protein [Chryseobacterium sp. GP-SGM7]|uniref:hypothetical protein n=1 Tax=Chryseobacterium sp. GP-SGM7 TaxID=3411323 RepID=UPI003B92BF4F